MSDTVHLEIGHGVALVTVDCPPTNALGDEVLHGLEHAITRIVSDSGVRAVVLTGAGTEAFMSGPSMAEFERLVADPERIATFVRWSGTMLARWAVLPQPLIAAVQASAVGTGLEVVLLCDLVIADPAARFGLPDVKYGLVPGSAATQRLPRRIGVGAAKDLLLTGRLIDAAEAQRLGLVNQVTEPGGALPEALALARHIASLPRGAVAAIKCSVDDGRQAQISEALDHERKLILKAFRSPDFQESMAAWREQRPPRFNRG